MNQIVFSSMRFVVTAEMDENDPYAHIKEVDSELLCYAYDDMEDADDEPVVAGKLSFCVVDVYGAQQFGISLSELFDQTAELWDCYTLLFDPVTETLSTQFEETFDYAPSANILLLNRLEILPTFRKRRIGLAAIARTLTLFGGDCGYAVLKAAPLQFESRNSGEESKRFAEMQLAHFGEDKERALGKLQAYYARLGFRPIGNDGWMALNLGYERPDMEALGVDNL